MNIKSYLFSSILFLSASLMHATDIPDSNFATETLEGGPSAIVAGCVNAITGDFFDSYVALTIPGAQPLVVQCSYCSSEKEWGFEHMPDLEVGLSNGRNHVYARYLDDKGSGKTYRGYANEKGLEGYSLTIPPALFEKALTNCGSGIICGKTNLRNSYISLIRKNEKKSYRFQHGSGINRTFCKNGAKSEKTNGIPMGKFYLRDENHPNGNRLRYKYKKDKLARVRVFNQANLVLASLCLNRDKSPKLVQWASESKSVTFMFEDKDEKQISKVFASHAFNVSYRYNKRDLLDKKNFPEGRFLEILYYEFGKQKGRVYQLKTALGVAYTFIYDLDSGQTRVIDSKNNLIIYCYDKKSKRLQSIKRFDKTNQIVSQDNFYWSNSKNTAGNLNAKTFEGNGKSYFSRIFNYDTFGNVTGDHLFGNLTGNALQPLKLQNASPTTTSEEYVKRYHYSQDGQNLLLVENDGKKLICFEYYPNQLLKSRLTKITEGKIIKREFFEYDINGVLIKEIRDDGQDNHPDHLTNVFERHIKVITPRTVHPIGLPQVLEEYYVDIKSLQNHLVKRIINHHSLQGKLLQEDHYGSDGIYAYSLKWEYDNLGNVIKKTDALSQTTIYAYDGNSNKIREEGPQPGWYKELKYDLCNNLILETEYWPDGTILSNTNVYNSLNQRVASTNIFGQVSTFEYNVLGHLVKTYSPDMFNSPFSIIIPVIETEYDPLGNAIVKKDPNGWITNTFYTIRGQPYRIEYPDGSIEERKYSLAGLLIKEIAKNGLITTYTYDPLDRIIATHITDPQGTLQKTTNATYSTFHLLAETDEEGLVTSYEYDWAGRCTAVGKGDHLTNYEYDTLERVIKTISNVDDVNVQITCKVYDLLNRVIEERIEDQYGEVFKKENYSYDVNGNKNSTTIHSQVGTAITVIEYLPNGRPFCITDALANQTQYFYDHAFFYRGQKVLYIRKVDPLGNYENTFFDTHGNICYQAQIAPNGSFIQRELSYYDPLGNKTLSEITVFQGEEEKRIIETRWEYDSMGNMTRSVDALGTPEQKVVEYDFNKFGQKDTTHMPNGIAILNEYDSFGRLSTYRSTDKTIHYKYTYDLKDRLILVEDIVHNTQNKRCYDEHGHLKSETLDNGLVLHYTYDQLDRPLTVTLPDKTAIHYHYSVNELIAVDRIKDDEVVYTHHYNLYDLAGNVAEETLLGQAGKIHYCYDLLGRTISVQAPHWEMTIPQGGFDATGNLLKREVVDNQGALTYTYAYDNLHQLISENGFISHTYQNDSIYNRTTKNDKIYSVNALNQLLDQSNCFYVYDNNGNLIEKTAGNQKKHYVYDALDRLIEVHNGSDITKYTYDSFHRRLSKTRKGLTTQFLYQGQNEIGAFEHGKMIQLRVLGTSLGAEVGGAIALEFDGEVFSPIHDPQGNIVAILESSGNLAESYRYTAFGETQECLESSLNNPWRYSSKRLDEETGFIFFGRRYYDPDIGRWITSDPACYADGPNLYAYVHNRPLIYIDPDGKLGLLSVSSISLGNMSTMSAMAHGAIDFAMSNIHALEQGAMYIGSDDLDLSPEHRGEMFLGLNERQASRMDLFDNIFMNVRGINHDDAVYNGVRHSTSLGLEIASLTAGASSLAKGAFNLARGSLGYSQILLSSLKASESAMMNLEIQSAKSIIGLKDGMTCTTSQALEIGHQFLGKGYKEVVAGSGRYVSFNGKKVFRMGANDILGKHGGGPHVNLETLVPHPVKINKMSVDENIHIFLKD